MAFLFDDAGSWPAPPGMQKGLFTEMANCGEEDYVRLIRNSIQKKIEAGLEVSTYPQFQNMCEQFLFLLRKEEFCEDIPYKIRREHARIPEISFIEEVAKKHTEECGERLMLKVCVTGPLELSLYEFGKTIDSGLLSILSGGVNAFLRNSCIDTTFLKTHTVSIDEPSVGLIDLNVEEDLLIDAWEKSASGMPCDVQMHLHSPLAANMAARAEGIDIVSAETAGHPEYVEILDRNLLEENDTSVRVGITRTDFDRLGSEYNEAHGTNVFKQERSHLTIARQETEGLIRKRLERAYETFGDLIRYAGPDCGLKSCGTDEAASLLLKTTKNAIDGFRREHRNL